MHFYSVSQWILCRLLMGPTKKRIAWSKVFFFFFLNSSIWQSSLWLSQEQEVETCPKFVKLSWVTSFLLEYLARLKLLMEYIQYPAKGQCAFIYDESDGYFEPASLIYFSFPFCSYWLLRWLVHCRVKSSFLFYLKCSIVSLCDWGKV